MISILSKCNEESNSTYISLDMKTTRSAMVVLRRHRFPADAAL